MPGTLSSHHQTRNPPKCAGRCEPRASGDVCVRGGQSSRNSKVPLSSRHLQQLRKDRDQPFTLTRSLRSQTTCTYVYFTPHRSRSASHKRNRNKTAGELVYSGRTGEAFHVKMQTSTVLSAKNTKLFAPHTFIKAMDSRQSYWQGTSRHSQGWRVVCCWFLVHELLTSTQQGELHLCFEGT